MACVGSQPAYLLLSDEIEVVQFYTKLRGSMSDVKSNLTSVIEQLQTAKLAAEPNVLMQCHALEPYMVTKVRTTQKLTQIAKAIDQLFKNYIDNVNNLVGEVSQVMEAQARECEVEVEEESQDVQPIPVVQLTVRD